MRNPRRARKRARKRSSDFRVLFWLLRREAAFTVLGFAKYGRHAALARAAFLRCDWRQIQRRALNPHKYYPGGRYIP